MKYKNNLEQKLIESGYYNENMIAFHRRLRVFSWDIRSFNDKYFCVLPWISSGQSYQNISYYEYRVTTEAFLESDIVPAKIKRIVMFNLNLFR